MEKTRVNKGEEYYYIGLLNASIVAFNMKDFRNKFDDDCFAYGNYFFTRKDAEAMAEKFRAVLKGADVIDMPSEEESEAEGDRQLELSMSCDDKWTEEAYLDGFADCLHWLKSKIK